MHERSRLAIWTVVIVLLLLAFVTIWKPIEKQVSDTAAIVATQQILQSANAYKQEWLLRGQPDLLRVKNHSLAMTPYGWVSPTLGEAYLDCKGWLLLHLPQERVLESTLLSSVGHIGEQREQCVFSFERGHKISVRFKNKELNVSVYF